MLLLWQPFIRTFNLSDSVSSQFVSMIFLSLFTILMTSVSVICLPESDFSTFIPSDRLVHLDLKGAAPKVSFLEQFFPFLKNLGATGLLIEYEDMFPFWGPIKALSASNAYKRREVEQILNLARENELEVIPLIQTFGHLEFGLKLPEFSKLREVAQHPQALCPSKNGSRDLIQHIVDQVMTVHQHARYLHIGCDEVYQLAQCSSCIQRLHNHGYNAVSGKNWIFLQHVKWVAEYVKKVHKVQPIIWDDMLRTIAERDLQEHLGDGLVQPMVWVYVSHIERFVDPSVWRKFSRVFRTVWGAGAFKGAFGSSLFTVNARRHLECTAEWLRILRVYGSAFPDGVAGYVLTGWQRYDHFANLCELLPAGMPSLAANLVLADSGGPLDDTIFKNVSVGLGCGSRSKRPSLKSLAKNPYMWEYSRCHFPGQRFFRLLRTFKQMRSRIKRHVRTVTEEQAWLTAYNVRHNYSSPMRISEAILWHTELILSAERLRKDIKQALEDIFDRHTVVEWLEQNIHPLFQSLAKLDADARSLMARDTWPARPLPTDPSTTYLMKAV